MEILFIHQYNTTFILRDKFFFEEHYPVIDLDFSRKYQNFLGRIKQIYFIFKKMKKADVAIIWFADFPAFIATFLKKITNTPTIVIIGGYELANFPQYNYGALQKPFSRWRVKKIIENATEILVVDESLKLDAENLLQKKLDKVKTVPTGYDSKKFYNIGDKENLILTVAAVSKISKAKLKGLEAFIEAAKAMTGIQFMIIGLQNDALQWAENLAPENLTIKSYVAEDKLLEYYQKAKVYCQLSCREGLPNALCEAMLCECVPVGTKVNGIPKAIGDTGFYTEFNNVNLTIDAIKQALEADIGQQARKRLQQLFPKSKRAEELSAVLGKYL
jgi:glycosyltransferase involved in cell wall biosynthesis